MPNRLLAAFWRPGPRVEISGALYPSRGDCESSPAGARPGAAHLPVERLRPWQPPADDDPRRGRVRAAFSPTCAPHGLPAYPPLWVAGESGTAGHPCPLSQCAPAAPRDPARAPTCPGASAQAGKARGTLSSLPAWAYGLGGPPRSPADTIRAGAATAQRRYLVGGLPQEHAPAIASRQGRSHVLPVQGDVRSQLVRAGSAVRGTPRQSGG